MRVFEKMEKRLPRFNVEVKPASLATVQYIQAAVRHIRAALRHIEAAVRHIQAAVRHIQALLHSSCYRQRQRKFQEI